MKERLSSKGPGEPPTISSLKGQTYRTMAKTKIMIVEDDRIVAKDIENTLKDLGFYISSIVSSGEEAIDKIKEKSPDLVLMDIVLKGEMDGIEAASHIRTQFNIPVVYLTAHADKDLLQRVKITESFGYILKPFEGRELNTAVEIALYKHKADKELRKSREQLRNLATYLQSVREQERTSVAREIHDELAQALTVLRMDISWLGKKLPKDQKTLLNKTKAMAKLTDTTIKTMKKISTELRPGLLDDLGLIAAIEWQVGEFQNRTGIKYKLTIDPDEIILDSDRSTTIFRIFQETLTNVTRHAKATMVNVSLKEIDGKLELRVRDNGKGITKEQITDPKSFGLMGIQERVHPWGGEVEIKGAPGKGTTVAVRIPVKIQ